MHFYFCLKWLFFGLEDQSRGGTEGLCVSLGSGWAIRARPVPLAAPGQGRTGGLRRWDQLDAHRRVFRALTVQLAPQRPSLLRLVLVAVVVCSVPPTSAVQQRDPVMRLHSLSLMFSFIRSHHRRLHRAPGAVRRDSPAVHAKCHRPGLLTRTSHAKVQPNLCFPGAASQAPSITCQLHEVCPLQVPPSYHSFSGFIDLKSFLYLRVSLRKRAYELRLLISFQHTLK